MVSGRRISLFAPAYSPPALGLVNGTIRLRLPCATTSLIWSINAGEALMTACRLLVWSWVTPGCEPNVRMMARACGLSVDILHSFAVVSADQNRLDAVTPAFFQRRNKDPLWNDFDAHAGAVKVVVQPGAVRKGRLPRRRLGR